MSRSFKNSPAAIMLLLVALGVGLPVYAATTTDVVRGGERRLAEGAAAQQQVDAFDRQTRELAVEYANTLKIVDHLASYNRLLEQQIANQRQELDAIAQSMQQVTLLERQILPLLLEMVESLAAFVRLDLPFLPDERAARLERLESLLARSDVGVAEKLRQVLEAYQIETEYGRTIEAYKGTLSLGTGSVEVEFLRFGRLALMYQTLDGAGIGAWDAASGDWVELPAEPYRRQIRAGLRIARKQRAPELLVVPLPAAIEAAP